MLTRIRPCTRLLSQRSFISSSSTPLRTKHQTWPTNPFGMHSDLAYHQFINQHRPLLQTPFLQHSMLPTAQNHLSLPSASQTTWQSSSDSQTMLEQYEWSRRVLMPVIEEPAEQEEYQLETVLKWRRRKMRLHKLKKWRKRMRAGRRRELERRRKEKEKKERALDDLDDRKRADRLAKKKKRATRVTVGGE